MTKLQCENLYKIDFNILTGTIHEDIENNIYVDSNLVDYVRREVYYDKSFLLY